VPFEWVELGSNEQAPDELGLENLDDSRLPICIFPVGQRCYWESPARSPGSPRRRVKRQDRT
jgi:hypothetical protein